jgi:hypothetical protein
MNSYILDPGGSGQLFAEASACIGRSGDLQTAYSLQNNAGVQALLTGDMPAARAHLEQALQINRVVREDESVVSINLAWVLRAEQDPDAARARFEAVLRTGRRTGQRYVLAYGAVGLACLAADLGDWPRAAVLHGVAQAFLDRIGERWQEPEEGYRSGSIGQIRKKLGDDAFELVYAEGRALGFDDAIDTALGRARPA